MSDYHTFALGPTVLQSGLTVPNPVLAYQTYGTLNADKTNVVVYPTSYGAQHYDIEWLIRPGGILDPETHFIVIPNMSGNGLSTSPSTIEPPHSKAYYTLDFRTVLFDIHAWPSGGESRSVRCNTTQSLTPDPYASLLEN